MSYSPTGSVLSKDQLHQSRDNGEPVWETRAKTTYQFDYKYEGKKPHAPNQIGENAYTYDANGNQASWHSTKSNQRRDILWDEENRIRAIAENGSTHHYIYDASGERVIKATGDGQAIYINGFPMGGSGTVGNYTMYVNPFMVVSNSKYTKHFYIEGQRIVSKLGEMGVEQDLLKPKSHAGDSTNNPVKWDNRKELTKDIIIANFEALGLEGAVFTTGKSGKVPYGQIKKYFRGNDVVINPGTPSPTTSQKTEDLQFYYHPDHLGSGNYITDASGEVYQHQEYFPFGETFVEERNDAEYTTYLFNGKELDEETGLYYYGARYYDPRTSVWQSVDPLAEKYRRWSPYNYGVDNPMRFIDPDGMGVDGYQSVSGEYQWFDNETADMIVNDNKLWIKFTDSKEIFTLAKAAFFGPELTNSTNSSEITRSSALSRIENWLDSPSGSFGEGALKVAANIGYSIVNSPVTLLTGKSLGGTPANTDKKMSAFIDVAPAAVLKGLTVTKEVIQVESGLNGYNKFVKQMPGITTSKGLPHGMTWQKRAGQMFQVIDVNQKALKDFSNTTRATTVITTTEDELKK